MLFKSKIAIIPTLKEKEINIMLNVVRVDHGLPFQKNNSQEALFLEVEKGYFLCVFTSEQAIDKEYDCWIPSAIYQLNESDYTRTTISVDDIWQIEESLLNFFIKHSKKMNAEKEIVDIRITSPQLSKPAF